jgi:stearoyl-CoA desaturase (delta-9 desaturase)
MVACHHVTFCINSVCHYLGRQTYSDKNSAKDSWFAAVLTFGEGYHNFHHAFPNDYRNGVRYFHWDPTKWAIRFLLWTGLVDQLRRVREDRILMARLEMDQMRVVGRLSVHSEAVRVKVQELLAATRQQLQDSHTRLLNLKETYRDLKRKKIDQVSHTIDDLGLELRRELRMARQELRVSMTRWQSLIDGGVFSLSQ